MKSVIHKHHVPQSKQDTQDDLKSIPMAELLKKLGASENGLSQAA